MNISSSFLVMRILIIALLVFLVGASANAWAQDAPLTPAQVAFVKAETRKADEQFVQGVARITGVAEQVIRDAMPTEDRISDPAARVIAVAEKARKASLTEQQKSRIASAEQARRRAIANARDAARAR